MRAPPLSLNAWLRWDVVLRELAQWPDVRSVLELGAGLGAVGARLAERYEYVGVEPDARSFEVARARVERAGRGTVLHGDVSAVDPERRFDLVCAFEVLEHLVDDAGALCAWVERLRPGGRVLVSVPAWRRRFGRADAMAGHVRRYDPDALERVLRGAGLDEVRLVGYGFPLAHALQPLWNLAARRDGGEGTSGSGRWFQPTDALAPVTAAVAAPFRLAQRPFTKPRLAVGLVASGARPT